MCEENIEGNVEWTLGDQILCTFAKPAQIIVPIFITAFICILISTLHILADEGPGVWASLAIMSVVLLFLSTLLFVAVFFGCALYAFSRMKSANKEVTCVFKDIEYSVFDGAGFELKVPYVQVKSVREIFGGYRIDSKISASHWLPFRAFTPSARIALDQFFAERNWVKRKS